MARKSRVQVLLERFVVDQILIPSGLYIRLSDEDEEDIETNSIGNQEKIGRHYLVEHPDITLVETYIDNGYTGMNFNRPAFLKMMEDLRSGKIRCVIIKDISRLGRHFVLTSELVERIFPQMQVRLISINDDYDSDEESADTASLTLPLKMVMNDYYVKDISGKIRSSICAKIESGEYLPSAGSIPYGYVRNAEKNTYDIDPESAKQVVRIYEMRAEGMKFNAIAKQLNAEGVPCPGKLRFLRGISKAPKYENAEWIRGTIRKITNDEAYIGHRIHGRVKRDKVGAEKKRRGPEEWSVIENAHPAIISTELFEKVQAVNERELGRLSNYHKQPDPEMDFRKLFHGKLFCADCGSAMSAGKGCPRSPDKPSWIYFDCNNYRYSNHSRCNSHYIRQETVMGCVTNLLNQQVKIAGDIENLMQSLQRMPSVSSFQNKSEQSLMSTVTKRRNLEGKIERLLEDLSDGLIDREQYMYMKRRYNQQLTELVEEEKQMRDRTEALKRVLDEANEWVSAVRKYAALPELSRELLDLLVDSIIVYDHKHIKVNLKYADPYQIMESFLREIEVVESA